SGARTEIIHEAFTEVAKCIQAHRFCFCRMEPTRDGGFRASKRRVWDAAGRSVEALPRMDFPADSLILRDLLQGKPVQRRRSEANREDAGIFARVDALSFITVPVFFDDQLWGLLKYDDVQTERIWHEAEIKALELASQTIGAALRDRESQEEIRRITQRHRDLTDNAPFCVHELDLEGRIRSISKWGYCALGFQCEADVVGLRVTECVHPDDRALYSERLASAIAGEYCEFEFRMTTPDGFTECNTTMIPIRNTDGNVTHVMGTTSDISRRREAEREAATMRQRLGRAEAASNVMRCIVGLDSTWKSVPARLCRLLGYTRAEMMQTTCAALTHPDDLESETALKTTVYKRESDSFEMEKRFIRKDGTPVWVYLSGTMMRDEQGRDDRWLAFIRDISEEKESEEELRKSKQDLRALAKRLQNVREEDFTRISREVHDELGQSLTALKMDVGWIDRRLEGKEESRQFREKIDGMYAMIDRTIEHVREISTSLRPPILDDLGIAGALEQLVADFSQSTHCRFERARELEALCPTRDQATAIYRIVQEVLTNITRHANAKEVEIAVDRSASGGLLLTIRDDGIGFDESRLTHNEMLGIVGMRERAVVFGGEVQFECAPGGGTLVSLHIPLRRGEPSP
ncbi:MAG: PAS domain S-box protein, partial [Gemmatimonadetes bacterium]|nr:PAS domain S-box protein [Gemmatimonadota bacterium]